MKTITDFKKRLKLGVKINSKLYWIKDNEYIQQNEIKEREVVRVQTNCFALSVPGKEGSNGSYCD